MSDRGHRLRPTRRQGDRRRTDRRCGTLFHFEEIHRTPGRTARIGGAAAGAPNRPQIPLLVHALQPGPLRQQPPPIRAQRHRAATRPAEPVRAQRIEREQPQPPTRHQHPLAFGQELRRAVDHCVLHHDGLQALGRQRERQRTARVAAKAATAAIQPQATPLQGLARWQISGRSDPQPGLRRARLQRRERQLALQLEQAAASARFKPG